MVGIASLKEKKYGAPPFEEGSQHHNRYLQVPGGLLPLSLPLTSIREKMGQAKNAGLVHKYFLQ